LLKASSPHVDDEYVKNLAWSMTDRRLAPRQIFIQNRS
jgi:hypothetical protein